MWAKHMAALLVFAAAFAVPSASAQAVQSQADPGVTPDSFLYGIDVALDNLRMAIASGDKERAMVGLQIAEERLAEVRATLESGKVEAAARAQEEHARFLRGVNASVFSLRQIDDELLNRCLVLSVDENREQTRAIHKLQRQRQTLPGLLARQGRQDVIALHRNAQRLLKPLLVVNPYAEALTFLDAQTRTRRDHAKYLTLIRTITLLHQHQRPVRTIEHAGKPVDYIESTLEDIEIANRLAHEVLGRSLDELPPQTRRLLDLIDELVTRGCEQQGIDRADYRFSRRDVREHTGWGHSQLAVHLKRLEELEYLLVHRGGRGRSFAYELLYEKSAHDERFLVGLIDVAQLRRDRPGAEVELPGDVRPQSGVIPGRFRGLDFDASPAGGNGSSACHDEVPENAHEDRNPTPSYPETNHAP